MSWALLLPMPTSFFAVFSPPIHSTFLPCPTYAHTIVTTYRCSFPCAPPVRKRRAPSIPKWKHRYIFFPKQSFSITK
jgi:hypothetical protein